jgi:hypothetical protein
MQLHELLGECQAKPRALVLPLVVPADLTKLLEDRRLVLGRDPDSRVADRDARANRPIAPPKDPSARS